MKLLLEQEETKRGTVFTGKLSEAIMLITDVLSEGGTIWKIFDSDLKEICKVTTKAIYWSNLHKEKKVVEAAKQQMEEKDKKEEGYVKLMLLEKVAQKEASNETDLSFQKKEGKILSESQAGKGGSFDNRQRLYGG